MEQTSMNDTRMDCLPGVHLQYRRLNNPARSKAKSRRKYVFTDQIDQLIREIYRNRRESKLLGHPVAVQEGRMPHWALKKRARELGLARTKELPWSEKELEVLARYAWMSDERIRLKLKAVGFSRTATGIHLKLKRMRFKHEGSFYSANSLSVKPSLAAPGIR